MRNAFIHNQTAETNIKISLTLDGKGMSEIDSGCGFLDHMLTLFAKHGNFDLSVSCKGDTYVDYHHTVEDIGIALGDAFQKALGDKRGIIRYGSMILPMDEALILSSVDLSGRAYLGYTIDVRPYTVGGVDVELFKEFFLAFTRRAACTLHIRQLAGENVHHVIEGIFKSVARSLKTAVAIDEKNPDTIPSTKGTL
ncbi:MAG: imidazoleglycerol-phosphate dehydratase HisB [Clostridia bacterium]|nr:imidazoleglycerol-phosphate dehydratase HisB [Clostridia bacterium]